MTDNIRPEHYRQGEMDLFEAWYQIYPFDQYRAIMQSIAERYMRRDKHNRVEDLDKAMYTLERLKAKELEQDNDAVKIYHLKELLDMNMEWIARDLDGDIRAFKSEPEKDDDVWVDVWGFSTVELGYDVFPQIKWSDSEPTKIADLLETYENGGESGN